MALRNLFPTLVYFEKAAPRLERFNKELLGDIYKIRDFDQAGQKWSKKNYLGGYTSYSSITDLHKRFPGFDDLEKIINRHVSKFTKSLHYNLGGGKLKMSSCWINIMPHSTHHSFHIHPLSVLSGTYYVSVPSNTSGLKIEDPRLAYFMATPPRKDGCPESFQHHVEFSPKPGHLILFESWVRHEVPANPVKKRSCKREL